jgi:hypothetical protein
MCSRSLSSQRLPVSSLSSSSAQALFSLRPWRRSPAICFAPLREILFCPLAQGTVFTVRVLTSAS